MKQIPLLRAAWQVISTRLLLEQTALAVIIFLLFLFWIRVPDGNFAEVSLSALLAIVLLLIAFAGEAALLLQMRGIPMTRPGIARGSVAIFLAVLLLFPLSSILTHAGANDQLRAGYINSQLPAGMRHIFSFPRLVTILQQTWDALFWAVVIVLTMAAVAITVARKPLQAIGRMLQSMTAWVVLSLATIIASETTLKLLHWTPGHGLSVEATSVALRVIAVVGLDVVLLCVSLAVLMVLARESDASYTPLAMVAGTPDLSQLRTVDKP